jgi:hypothetical protein
MCGNPGLQNHYFFVIKVTITRNHVLKNGDIKCGWYNLLLTFLM